MAVYGHLWVKTRGERVDAHTMLGEFLPLLTTGGIALMAAFMLWYTFAKTILFERDIHALTVDAHSLQIEYAKRIAALHGNADWGDAELVLDEREEAILAKLSDAGEEAMQGEQAEAPTAQAA